MTSLGISSEKEVLQKKGGKKKNRESSWRLRNKLEYLSQRISNARVKCVSQRGNFSVFIQLQSEREISARPGAARELGPRLAKYLPDYAEN